MTTQAPTAGSKAAARSSMDYETFLSKLGPKDRTNVERHVAAAEAEQDTDHAKLWKRLASHLMGLAPHAAKTTGQQSVQFFIADGKYRMQVFAIEDLRDGKITIYAGNALKEAMAEGLLTPPARAERESNAFSINGSKDKLVIEELDGKTLNPSAFYKDMLGWNRKAIRITLLTNATSAQASAIESVCSISARKWTSGN